LKKERVTSFDNGANQIIETH